MIYNAFRYSLNLSIHIVSELLTHTPVRNKCSNREQYYTEFFFVFSLWYPLKTLFSNCLPPSFHAALVLICSSLCSSLGPPHPGYFKLLTYFLGMWTITMALGVKAIRKGELREMSLPMHPIPPSPTTPGR